MLMLCRGCSVCSLHVSSKQAFMVVVVPSFFISQVMVACSPV